MAGLTPVTAWWELIKKKLKKWKQPLATDKDIENWKWPGAQDRERPQGLPTTSKCGTWQRIGSSKTLPTSAICTITRSKVFCIYRKIHNNANLKILIKVESGWQKLHGSTGGTRRKVWARTKFLSPNMYAILSRIKICHDLRTFWRSLGKKSAFLGQKQCFLGKKCTITWYILHISLS